MKINLLKALAVFVIWLLAYNTIDSWGSALSIVAHMLGVVIPITVVFLCIANHFGIYIKKPNEIDIEDYLYDRPSDRSQGFLSFINRFRDSNLFTPSQPEHPVSLITPAQVRQLKKLRKHISLEDAQQFPRIRISGGVLANVIPDAGIFTAKINRHGSIQNLVVMLSTLNAVSQFKHYWDVYSSDSKFFWAEGYLLPSRTGICYSVLYVTSFRLCNNNITF